MTNSMRSELFGGNGGASFDDSHDIDTWGRVRQIVVRHGVLVDSIGLLWANGNFLSHGGLGGTENVITFDPDEFITRIDGRSGSKLDQIIFHSNKRAYGPFGGGGGNPFTVDFAGKALHYIFGQTGAQVDQIGFAFGDQPPPMPTSIVRSSGHGGAGGNPFDDLSSVGGLLGKINAIVVRHGTKIDNIGTIYDGQSGGSITHGGNGGTQDIFELTSNEWITEIRGRSGSALDQVQFVTNLGRMSPAYGGNGGTPFRESRGNSVVKALFGRSGSAVDQLGVYFEDAKPIAIEITSLTYDLSHLNILEMSPEGAMSTFLVNEGPIAQQMSQSLSVGITDTTTTTVSETSQTSVSVKISGEFTLSSVVKLGAEVTVGYQEGTTFTTGSSNAVQTTHNINFSATVPPKSKILATCVGRKSNYNVPWTAVANVTYQDRPTITMTLHGTLSGVVTTSVDTEYGAAVPL
jgi:Jacalin-like lectin domain/Clostridium epsilon toxin ETX/Bacillus mosquitocidal toxin MTX2